MAEFYDTTEFVWGPAAEHWRRAVSRISTAFGRLVFLASLRDQATSRYVVPDASLSVNAEDTDGTLCRLHQLVFAEWLGFSLAEQMADLRDYLRSSDDPRQPDQYRLLVPRSASDVERRLYLTDLETLLELLAHGTAAPSPTPTALPPLSPVR